MRPAESLRTKVFADLNALGFHPAPSLPLPDMDPAVVRPAGKVAARLMALGALFTWVAFPEHAAPTPRLQRFINRNGLCDRLAKGEADVIDLPRADANDKHAGNIGWKLENI